MAVFFFLFLISLTYQSSNTGKDFDAFFLQFISRRSKIHFVSPEGSGSASNHDLDLSLGNSSSKQNSRELVGEIRNLAVDQQHNSVPFEVTFRRDGYNENEAMQLLSQTHIQSPNSLKANEIMQSYGQFENRGEPQILNMATSQFSPSNFQVSIKHYTHLPILHSENLQGQFLLEWCHNDIFVI